MRRRKSLGEWEQETTNIFECVLCARNFCYNVIFICGWNPNRYLQPGVLSWVPDLYIWIPPRYFYLYIFMASQKLRIPKWNLDNEITSKRKSMWMLLFILLFFSLKLQKRRKGRCGVDTDKLQKWQNDEGTLAYWDGNFQWKQDHLLKLVGVNWQVKRPEGKTVKVWNSYGEHESWSDINKMLSRHHWQSLRWSSWLFSGINPCGCLIFASITYRSSCR